MSEALSHPPHHREAAVAGVAIQTRALRLRLDCFASPSNDGKRPKLTAAGIGGMTPPDEPWGRFWHAACKKMTAALLTKRSIYL